MARANEPPAERAARASNSFGASVGGRRLKTLRLFSYFVLLFFLIFFFERLSLNTPTPSDRFASF